MKLFSLLCLLECFLFSSHIKISAVLLGTNCLSLELDRKRSLSLVRFEPSSTLIFLVLLKSFFSVLQTLLSIFSVFTADPLLGYLVKLRQLPLRWNISSIFLSSNAPNLSRLPLPPKYFAGSNMLCRSRIACFRIACSMLCWSLPHRQSNNTATSSTVNLRGESLCCVFSLEAGLLRNSDSIRNRSGSMGVVKISIIYTKSPASQQFVDLPVFHLVIL